jgi:tight adherence protein B
MIILICVLLFITVVLFVEGTYFAYAALRDAERQRVRRYLHDVSLGSGGSVTIDITHKHVLSNIPWLHQLLSAIPFMQSLSRLMEQANSSYHPSTFLVLSLMLCFTGLLLVQKPFNIAAGVGLGLMPLLFLSHRRRQRLQRFERQLPEALDFVARALKAGHTLNVGMKMASDEFPEPAGTEFAKTVDEINFGAGIQEALANLSYRVDCADLQFFVTAVMVQRESGGNLAEVVEKAGALIRQRFELLGRVRVLASEGKLSAMILIALPFLLSFATYFLHRDYFMLLLTDPTGKWLVVAAGFLMAIGIGAVVRMIRIKV